MGPPFRAPIIHPFALPRPPSSAAPWRPLSSAAARPLASELAQATSSPFPRAATTCLEAGYEGNTAHAPGHPRTLHSPECRGWVDSRSSTPTLASYLQQLHVAGGEPATEPVVLLTFPPTAVRDLEQREQLARSKA